MNSAKLLAILGPLAAAALAGCNGRAHEVPSAPPAPVDRADALHVQCSHAPVNWDGQGGPDGVLVLVHLFRQSESLPVTVRGLLSFDLYEGVVGPAEIAKARPIRSWRYRGDQLRALLTRTVWGWGYTAQLGWGEAVPRTSSVTLLARYLPADGEPIVAEPIVIPMGPR